MDVPTKAWAVSLEILMEDLVACRMVRLVTGNMPANIWRTPHI